MACRAMYTEYTGGTSLSFDACNKAVRPFSKLKLSHELVREPVDEKRHKSESLVFTVRLVNNSELEFSIIPEPLHNTAGIMKREYKVLKKDVNKI